MAGRVIPTIQKVYEQITGKQTYEGDPDKDRDVYMSEQLIEQYDVGDRASWVEQALEDDQFANGMMWSTDHIAELDRRNMSSIVVPLIPEIVEYAVGMLTHNSPRFQGTAKEESDTEAAAFMSDLMAHIWYISDGDQQYERAMYDLFVRSMGVMIAYADPVSKEVYIRALNPLDIYLPPSCKNPFADDADSIIIRTFQTAKQIIMRYPDWTEEGAERSSGAEDANYRPSTDRDDTLSQVVDDEDYDPSTDMYEVLDRYTKIRQEHHRVIFRTMDTILDDEDYEEFREEPAIILQNIYTNQPEFIINDEEVSLYQELGEQGGGFFHLMERDGKVEMMPGPEHELAVPNSTTAVGLVTKGQLIDEELIEHEIEPIVRIHKVESAGGKLLWKGIMPISDYPIVTMMNRHNRNPYPMSTVRLGKGLNEYINKLRQLIVAHTTNSVGTTVLYNMGAGINQEELETSLSRAGVKAIGIPAEEDIRKQILQLQPLPLSGQLFADIDMAKKEIRDLFGVYQFMEGDPGSAPTTFRGTLAIDEYGQRRINAMRKKGERALNKLGSVVLELIQSVYTESRVIPLVQPNNKTKTFEINRPVFDPYSQEIVSRINDVQMVKDIIVVSGSSLPSNRWARLEYYLALREKGILMDDETILRETDIPDLDRVLENHSIIARQAQQIEQLSGQLKLKEGELQRSRTETKHALSKAELQKFKTDLDEIASDAEVEAKKTELEIDHLIREASTMRGES